MDQFFFLYATILLVSFGCVWNHATTGKYFTPKQVSRRSKHKFEIGQTTEERTFTKCMMKCENDRKCHSIVYNKKDDNVGDCNIVIHSPKASMKTHGGDHITEVYKEVKMNCKKDDFVIHTRRHAKSLPFVEKYFNDFHDSTVCLWFHTKRMPSTRQALFAINHDSVESSCNAHFQLLLYQGKFGLHFRKDSPLFSDSLIKPIAQTWTHVCLLRRQSDDQTSYKYFLYVNATRVGFLTGHVHHHSGEKGRYIFNLAGELDVLDDKCVVKKEKKLFHGKLARVYMFNELLSYSDIKSLYHGKSIYSKAMIDWNEFRGRTDTVNNYEHECEFEGNDGRSR